MPRKPVNKQAVDVLADAGHALYSEHWRIPLGEALGINPETIRKFMSGRMAVPDAVLDRVGGLVRQRAAELLGIAEKIEKRKHVSIRPDSKELTQNELCAAYRDQPIVN